MDLHPSTFLMTLDQQYSSFEQTSEHLKDENLFGCKYFFLFCHDSLRCRMELSF